MNTSLFTLQLNNLHDPHRREVQPRKHSRRPIIEYQATIRQLQWLHDTTGQQNQN